MKIVVDADACPVKREIISIAKRHNLDVVMVCDTSHVLSDEYAKIVVVDKGSDSADFALINLADKGDIVVTQDYGVAAMALAKGSGVISNSGIIFTKFNIDAYLAQRHLAKENRRKGGKFPKTKKQTKEDQGASFVQALNSLIG
ncbi:MAG: YaiI/YqxD family protein [Clostridia bacterium]|nr:YaiI/YqxD family protein [Clostridia bacterium]